MGRPAKFTDEQIMTACNELDAEGQKVTQGSVLGRLGGGSTLRIAKVIKDFRHLKSDSSTELEVPKMLQSVFVQEVNKATNEIQATYIETQKADAIYIRMLEQKTESLETDLSEQTKNSISTQYSLDRASANCIEKSEQIEKLEARIISIERENAALCEKANMLQEQVKALTAEKESYQQKLYDQADLLGKETVGGT